MLDIVAIRNDPSVLDTALTNRGLPPRSAEILALDERRRALMTEQQQVQARRNALSKQVGEIKKAGGDADELMDEVKGLGPRLEELGEQEAEAAAKLDELLTTLPNLPDAQVPVGASEEDNVEVRRWGTPRVFDFAVKAHDDLATDLGLLDLATAAKISGARFTWLTGALARLDRAIYQYTLNFLTDERGLTEAYVPYLVNDAALFGTGQLPKFKEDLFATTDGRWLIPTSEVPLTNLGQDRIFKAEELPLKLTAMTPCFRSEAGSAGKDTKGIIRQHQFDKVEMVMLCAPEQSAALHEEMTANTEELLRRMGLPFRTIVLCTGDMGFGSRKTYDIEVWIPSQNTYRELSSCSNCGDFQARRMKARFKRTHGEGTEFIHTLNGSGITRRALVAVLENYQQADGSVVVPEVLRPYMGGIDVIRAAAR